MSFMALIPIFEKLVQGGGFDGVLGQYAAPAKAAVRGQGSPESMVLGAVGVLAEHVPADPARAQVYVEAVARVVGALAALRAALVKEAEE